MVCERAITNQIETNKYYFVICYFYKFSIVLTEMYIIITYIYNHLSCEFLKSKNEILFTLSSDYMWKWKSLSCVQLSVDHMDYTIHGILQARILEWVAIPFFRGSSQPGIEPRSPTLQADSLPAEPPGIATNWNLTSISWIDFI